MELSGHIRLRAEPRPGNSTVIGAQSFRAPFHLSKPHFDAEASVLVAQIVNPTAGILSGDRLTSEIEVAAGAALMVTSPSATRVFTMERADASSSQRFCVESGGWLEVFPEALVPHRGSRFSQTTRIEVAPGGAAFVAELLVPGRLARGEFAQWDSLSLRTDVVRAGELCLRERFAHSGAEVRALAERSHPGGTVGFGTAFYLPAESGPASGVPGWVAELERLQGGPDWVGASQMLSGGWTVRFMSADGDGLRRLLRAIRARLAQIEPRLTADPRKL